VKKFCPSKFRTLFLEDQSGEVQDESQKKVVFIENEGSDLEDNTDPMSFLTLLGVLLLSNVL